jgi:cytochrome c oxidase assembly factor CtaG
VSPYAWAASAEALVLVPALALLYALAVRRRPPPRWRVSCLALALALILLAFVTPLQTLALHYLLTAHLLQNVVLAEWAPALLVLALPRDAVERIDRVTLVRRVTAPLVALPAWIGTYFVWHVPAIYDFALRRPHSLLHVEHVSYLVAGLLLWWPALTGRLRAGATAA